MSTFNRIDYCLREIWEGCICKKHQLPQNVYRKIKKTLSFLMHCVNIWNEFDAQADTVCINLHTNEFGLINMISVVDNGTGIAYEELSNKFKPFNESKKADNSKKINHSLPHGRQGIGRLTFFAFAQRASTVKSLIIQ